MLLVEREWRGVGEDFDAGWPRVGPRITTLLAAAQVGAAIDGAASVPVALEQSGYPLRQVARVSPAAFAGVASDGRRLDSLAYGAVVKARAVGATCLAGRLRAGSALLHRATHLQGPDAGRAAPQLIVMCLALLGWAYVKADGFGAMLSAPSAFAAGGPNAGQFWGAFWPSLTAMVGVRSGAPRSAPSRLLTWARGARPVSRACRSQATPSRASSRSFFLTASREQQEAYRRELGAVLDDARISSSVTVEVPYVTQAFQISR